MGLTFRGRQRGAKRRIFGRRGLSPRDAEMITNPPAGKIINYLREGHARRYAKSEKTKRGQWSITETLLRFAGFPEGTKLLDAGCGAGHSMRCAGEHGYDVCGVDISPVMVRVTKEMGTERVKRGHMLKLPFENGEFGGIISSSALQWVFRGVKPENVRGQAERLAQEFKRVLMPGGKAAIHFFPSPLKTEEVGLIRGQKTRVRKKGARQRWRNEDWDLLERREKMPKKDITPVIRELREEMADKVVNGFRDAGFVVRVRKLGAAVYMVAEKPQLSRGE